MVEEEYSFIHSLFNTNFLSSCYVSGIILNVEDTAVNKRNKLLALMELMFPLVKQTINKQIETLTRDSHKSHDEDKVEEGDRE